MDGALQMGHGRSQAKKKKKNGSACYSVEKRDGEEGGCGVVMDVALRFCVRLVGGSEGGKEGREERNKGRKEGREGRKEGGRLGLSSRYD